MKRTRWILVLSLPFLLSACSDSTLTDPLTVDPQFSKQGPKGGKAAYALEFSGAQSTRTPDADDLDLAATWTIEAWINPNNPTGGRQDLVSKWGYGTEASYDLWIEAGFLKLSTRIEPTNTIAVSDGTLTADVWQHVAAVFDQGTVSLYVDGMLDKAVTGMHVPQASVTVLSLGRELSPAPYLCCYFFGQMDDVRIWSVARTEAQIQASMKNVKGKDKAGLIAWWKLDEGEGDIAFDAVGGHHMQLGDAVGEDVGDPVWVKEPKKR